MKRHWYITIAAVVFVASLIAQAPAATLYGWFKPKAPTPVELLGVQGTISEGRAAGLSVNGRSALGNLHWTLKPWRLFMGQFGFHLEGSGDTALDTRVAVPFIGGIHVDDLRASMGVKALLTAIGQPFLPLDGQSSLQLKTLRLRSQKLKFAEGRVEVHGLAWTLSQEPIVLGDYAATISTENDIIVVKLEPLAGALELNGTAKLSPDQTYNAQIQLRPKSDAPPLLNSLLSSIGPADAQGWHHINQQGKLP